MVLRFLQVLFKLFWKRSSWFRVTVWQRSAQGGSSSREEETLMFWLAFVMASRRYPAQIWSWKSTTEQERGTTGFSERCSSFRRWLLFSTRQGFSCRYFIRPAIKWYRQGAAQTACRDGSVFSKVTETQNTWMLNHIISEMGNPTWGFNLKGYLQFHFPWIAGRNSTHQAENHCGGVHSSND